MAKLTDSITWTKQARHVGSVQQGEVRKATFRHEGTVIQAEMGTYQKTAAQLVLRVRTLGKDDENAPTRLNDKLEAIGKANASITYVEQPEKFLTDKAVMTRSLALSEALRKIAGISDDVQEGDEVASA